MKKRLVKNEKLKENAKKMLKKKTNSEEEQIQLKSVCFLSYDKSYKSNMYIFINWLCLINCRRRIF